MYFYVRKLIENLGGTRLRYEAHHIFKRVIKEFINIMLSLC